MERIFDVIVVGAGPGGSSLATLLGRAGASTLVLDKAIFPRDKVCGDGLTPRALYWLDALGCMDQVLAANRSFASEVDLYLDGEHALTGKFSDAGNYPAFCLILRRKILDHILISHAVASGASFRPGCLVQRLRWEPDSVLVETTCGGVPVNFRARMVVGADGTSSIVSRALGNRIMEGTKAISLRGYYEGVQTGGAPLQVHFGEEYFPGYGWMFADGDGQANVGVGLAVDPAFPTTQNLHRIYEDFVGKTLRKQLSGAHPAGKPKGGWSCFFRPKTIVSDRVLLIGDAANMGDPVSGGGIHTAMESAHVAAPVVLEAIWRNDFSAANLRRYEEEWNRRNEADWRVGELFLTFAKNPNLSHFWMYILKVIANVAENDLRFRDFAAGVFSGAAHASEALNPLFLSQVVPLNPQLWISAALAAAKADDPRTAPSLQGVGRQILTTVKHAMASPLPTLGWGAEIATRMAGIANFKVQNEISTIAAARSAS